MIQYLLMSNQTASIWLFDAARIKGVNPCFSVGMSSCTGNLCLLLTSNVSWAVFPLNAQQCKGVHPSTPFAFTMLCSSSRSYSSSKCTISSRFFCLRNFSFPPSSSPATEMQTLCSAVHFFLSVAFQSAPYMGTWCVMLIRSMLRSADGVY